MKPRETARRIGEGAARWLRRTAARRALPRTGAFWVSLELPSQLHDVPGRFAGERAHTLLGVLQTLEAIADEPRVHGVLLSLRGAPGFAAAQSLRRALDAVCARGKAIAAWAESLDLVSLYVASAADRIWIPETGRVHAVGLRADAYYLRDLLQRFDVRPDVVRIGTHKSAGEMFTNQRMSDEQREQLDAIVADHFDALVEGIAAGRGRTAAQVREWIDRGRYTAAAAREAGLVDDCAYRDELDDRIGELASHHAAAPSRPELVDAHSLWALRANARGGLRAPPPRIAVLFASGAISHGAHARGIASHSAEEMLAALAQDERVRGVVLRIDSPGGDALASDLLWRAVRTLRREKPVVASVAEVAASGGYYIACAADCVIAERSSLTGSIGVIGGKVDLSGLFARMGVGIDAVERGVHAGMHSPARSFTDEERELVRGEMRALYDTFVARVAEGRGIGAAAVERAAQGRVFTGGRALQFGLVDALGGPLEALAEVRRRAGLNRAEPVLVDLHPRVSALRALSRWL